ncbi:Aste57867_17120 [Aphanomyces stellatus]|uniref:Aste57867_17120 protein n=1 Tax=Aphanomyces stellatus TaxID=120398 RepID=A0A485L880_9STRA|nr:hypothetical protein As57867_017061 [Aphanomyces stellatus]VFT93878.1 Aste57867_17120 [Aphanomyces stellatus]
MLRVASASARRQCARPFSSKRGRRNRNQHAAFDESVSMDSKFGKDTMKKLDVVLAQARAKECAPREPREASEKEIRRLEKVMAKKQERLVSPEYLAQPIFRPDSPAYARFGDKTMGHYEDRVPEGIFPGPVHVITTLEEEMVLRPQLESMRVVGVDCETKPSVFRNYNVSPIALVQLASDDVSVLYRVRWGGRWNPTLQFPGLQHVMASADVIKVGHGCDFDFKSLQTCNLASCIVNTVDTLPMASKIGCLKPNLRALGMIWRNMCISKAMQTSNWEATHLTPDQVSYAATDAWLARQGKTNERTNELMLELVQFEPARKHLKALHYIDSMPGASRMDSAAIVSRLIEVARDEKHAAAARPPILPSASSSSSSSVCSIQ